MGVRCGMWWSRRNGGKKKKKLDRQLHRLHVASVLRFWSQSSLFFLYLHLSTRLSAAVPLFGRVVSR